MADLLIRDLDARAHHELKRRAARSGRSLQSYVERVLEAHLAKPMMAEWLEQLDELEPVPGISGSEALSEARRELP